MKTLRYKKVGQYFVLKKFDELPVDPEMTRIANRKNIEESRENAAVNTKISKKISIQQKRAEILGKIRFSEMIIRDGETMINKIADKNEKEIIRIQIAQAPQVATSARKELRLQEAALINCDNELSELNLALEAKRRQTIRQNPIFSHSRKNEIALSDEKYRELKEIFDGIKDEAIILEIMTEEKPVIQEAEQAPVMAPFTMLVSYNKISDFSGREFFWKTAAGWERSGIISELGITRNDIAPAEYAGQTKEFSELSPLEIDEIRIQALSSEEKAVEKDAELLVILREAAFKRSELEIQGDAEALTKSQIWLQEQVEIIENKYK